VGKQGMLSLWSFGRGENKLTKEGCNKIIVVKMKKKKSFKM
jgi:hypothetical protein